MQISGEGEKPCEFDVGWLHLKTSSTRAGKGLGMSRIEITVEHVLDRTDGEAGSECEAGDEVVDTSQGAVCCCCCC